MEENEISLLFTFDTCLKEKDGQAVYLARRKSDGRRAVIYAADEKNSGEIRAEYAMLSKLCHPSVPKPFGIRDTGGRAYAAREYFEGEDLCAYVERNGTKDIDRIIDIMLGLCDALRYLHRQYPAVIHGDIRPGHIIIANNGEIKLIDFKSARYFDPGEDREAAFAKTRPYAAPEQFCAEADIRSDIYSLGMVMIYMLTGTHDKKMLKNISSEVTAVIDKCVQKRPEERYAAVECLQYDLYELQQKIKEDTKIHDCNKEDIMTESELYDLDLDYDPPDSRYYMPPEGPVCECGGKILYNHKNCPHCGKANDKYEKWGLNEFVYLIIIAGICAGLIFAFGAKIKFTGNVVACFVLLSPAFIFSVAETADRVLCRIKRKRHIPALCRHEFSENCCWCKKCGREVKKEEGEKSCTQFLL